MAGGKNRGFTVIEMMIVVAVLVTLIALLLPPLLSSLRIVNQEGTMLAMDQSANRALNAVTAALRQAVLPIKINDSDDNDVTVPDAVIMNDIEDFTNESTPLSFARFVNNDTVGFGTHGAAWLAALRRGTDFLPFCVPVPYEYDGSPTDTSVTTLDSAMLPQLGIFMADAGAPRGERADCAANYIVTDVPVGSGTTRSRLLWPKPLTDIAWVNSIHPALAAVPPENYNIQAGNIEPIDLADARFQPNPFGATATERACAILRFAPFRDASNNPHVISENGDAAFDLNEDGVYTDSYALGRIEILYIPGSVPHGGMQTIAVSTNTVLLHLNTDSESWQPLFRLRRGAGGGYAVDITLLLCDRISQGANVLAFNQATPFLVRRYNSSVELRNMAFR